MAVHKLILDDVFEDIECTLVGIHCAIEDYRLSYLLNHHLGISLIRKPKDIVFKESDSSYSLYEWEDEKQLVTWSLVSNICKIESNEELGFPSLFDVQQNVTKTYNLIPEYGRVNYFLKIDFQLNNNKEKHLINNILKIPHVTTAYAIDVSELKSKDNLIFN